MEKTFFFREGWLILINSILLNLSTYYLSLFRISMRVAKRLEKNNKRFFVGRVSEGRNSETVQRSKKKGIRYL